MIEIRNMALAANVGRPIPPDLPQVAAYFDVELDAGIIHGVWLYRDGDGWSVTSGENDVKALPDVWETITEKAVAEYGGLSA